MDDVSLTGALVGGDVAFGFEADLEGWSPGECGTLETLMGVASSSAYEILDPCCGLSGNTLEMHNDQGNHPQGQHELAVSNAVDVLNDVIPNQGTEGLLTILAEWDQYLALPTGSGVFYRPGWEYYPYECALPGSNGWSGRVGQNAFFYSGDTSCDRVTNVATAHGIPSDVERIRFIYEILVFDVFGMPVGPGLTGPTPLIDNVSIGFARNSDAPQITFAPSPSNSRFRDTFSWGTNANPYEVANCDVTINTNFGNTPPFVQADSLTVTGPSPTPESRWEARLWFQVERQGPAQNHAEYLIWRDRVADGRAIEDGAFAYAWMDCVQSPAGLPRRNAFASYFREDDDDYDPGAGEYSSGNEILPDGVFVPGTRLLYFVTANYTGQTDNYLLPDTTGQNYFEIDFLPGWFDDSGHWKYPSILCVNAGSDGDLMDQMLNVALEGWDPGDPLPAHPDC